MLEVLGRALLLQELIVLRAYPTRQGMGSFTFHKATVEFIKQLLSGRAKRAKQHRLQRQPHNDRLRTSLAGGVAGIIMDLEPNGS